VKVLENNGDKFNGKTIVMTGFRDAGLEEELKKRGVKIGSSVSKNTFLVLVKDKKGEEVMTGKVKDAKELGVPIVCLDDLSTFYTFAHFKCVVTVSFATHNGPQSGRFECAKV
jgi:NAD-dependent DNA ligase